MCSHFANTSDTCEDTNDDEHDLDDLFEDVEVMKMMAKWIGVWSLERKHYIAVVHIFQVAF